MTVLQYYAILKSQSVETTQKLAYADLHLKEVQRWTLWTVTISIFIVSNIVEIIPGRNVISLNILGVRMNAGMKTVRRTVSQFL